MQSVANDFRLSADSNVRAANPWAITCFTSELNLKQQQQLLQGPEEAANYTTKR